MEKKRFGNHRELSKKVEKIEDNQTEPPDSANSLNLDEKNYKNMSKSEPVQIIVFNPVQAKKKRILSSKLSRLSASLKSDFIRDFYIESKVTIVERIISFSKYFLFPQICSLGVGVCFILLFKSIFYESCFSPPNCICTTMMPKIISVFKEIISTWLIWYLVLFMNYRFSIHYRVTCIIIFNISIFSYYLLFPDENNFARYPIYLGFFVSNNLGSFLYSSGKTYKRKIFDTYRMNEFYFVMFSNYIFMMFIKNLKNLIGDVLFQILYNLYILLFFESMKRSLINYGRNLCKRNEILFENDKILFALNSRISLCFLLSFLLAPFLDFSYNNYYKYSLIFSYSHAILALYTRINVVNIILEKTLNFMFEKLKISFRLSSNLDETGIYLLKKISGSCYDMTFISTTSVFTFYFLKKTVTYSDCENHFVEEYGSFGIIISSVINFIITFILMYLIFKKKRTLFSYPIWKNIVLNIITLFVARCLFEANVINNYKKLTA